MTRSGRLTEVTAPHDGASTAVTSYGYDEAGNLRQCSDDSLNLSSSRRCVSPSVSTEIGARPSIGTVADSFDNALAETTNGRYKAECVRGPDAPAVWDDVDQLELETLAWVHWFNEHRLHSHCHDVPPAELESAFYADQQSAPTGVGIQ